MLRKSRPLMVAAGLASAAIALAMAPATAQAAPASLGSCYASSCTGHPAASYTCVNDAEIIYSVNLYDGSKVVGNVQLKWSPSCHASWARVVTENSGYDPSAYVDSSDSSAAYSESCPTYGNEGTATGCNTYMVDDLNPLTSFAYGQVYYGSTYTYAYTGSWLHRPLLSSAFSLTLGVSGH
jgi:hypothetical protein